MQIVSEHLVLQLSSSMGTTWKKILKVYKLENEIYVLECTPQRREVITPLEFATMTLAFKEEYS